MSLEGARIARWPRARARPTVRRRRRRPAERLALGVTRVDDPAFRALTFEQVRATYAEQIEALAQGGVDLLLIETIFDTLNAKAAIVAAREVAPELPLWLSFTIVDRAAATSPGRPPRRSGSRSSTRSR